MSRLAAQLLDFGRLYANRRMLLCVMTGFSAGLPLYVTINLLQAWLHRHDVGLRDIALFNLTGLPYTWKFLWAPLLDRYCPPFLGRRRGWAIVMQVALLVCIAVFGYLDPKRSLTSVAALAIAVAFFSATQDVALDAYRRELLKEQELGLGTALFVNAYRASALVPASLAFILADHLPWSSVYVIVAGFMIIGISASLWGQDGELVIVAPRTLKEAVVGPFLEFLARQDRSMAVLLLAFMLLYKLGDTLASALVTPFYLDLGFTLTQVGSVAKLVGIPATLSGALIGGIAMTKIGINRALWLFGVSQLLSTLGFAILSGIGPNPWALGVVVAFEYLTGGLGTSAFVAFLSRTTHPSFTATQYALFSSLIALPRTVASAGTGWAVELIGYAPFFVACALFAVPGLLLLVKVAPWQEPLYSPGSVRPQATASSSR